MERSFVVEARRPVVHLSRLRAEAVLRAAAEGRRVLLVTGPDARLTEPMRQVLTEADGRWVVDAGGLVRDGLTGVDLSGGAGAAPSTVAPAHLAPWTPEVEQLLITATVRHRPDRVALGVAAEVLLAALGLGPPTGWGPHEPAEHAWDATALTRAARAADRPAVRTVVVGASPGSSVGTLRARAHGRHVREGLQLVADAGARGTPGAQRALAAACEALARLAEATVPLSAAIWRRPGSAELTTAPRLQHAPMPIAVLVGAPGVRALGVDVGRVRSEFGALAIGPARLPALVVPIAGDWARLDALVDVLGRDRVLAAVRTAWPAAAG